MKDNLEEARSLIGNVISKNISTENLKWLKEKTGQADAKSLNSTFTQLPRKLGKTTINLTEEDKNKIIAFLPGFSIEGWTIDRLCRVWLLSGIGSSDKERYFRLIENLFLTAEMNELAALYSALPVLDHPELWVKRCAEGIRSNIGTVLEAIMYENPYPAANLEQQSWNQMVLKAFFTDKQIERITGLDERANKPLARTLSDYAHERWAASRTLNPQIWRLIGPFLDEELLEDIKKVLDDGSETERKAALLAVYSSRYDPAKALLNKYSDITAAIENKRLTWNVLAAGQNQE